jgi:glyoxylase I family protein
MPPFSLQTIDHVVIRAVNAAELTAFYVEAVGCTLVWDRPELGLTHLKAGNAMIDIVSIDGPLGTKGVSLPAGHGRNVDHLCLRIAPFDFVGLSAHFEAFGIDVAPPQIRFGVQRNVLSVYLTDPEGNGIEFKEDIRKELTGEVRVPDASIDTVLLEPSNARRRVKECCLMFGFLKKSPFLNRDLSHNFNILGGAEKRNFDAVADEAHAALSRIAVTMGTGYMLDMAVAVRKNGPIDLVAGHLMNLMNREDYSSAFRVSDMTTAKEFVERDHNFCKGGPGSGLNYNSAVSHIANEAALWVSLKRNDLES